MAALPLTVIGVFGDKQIADIVKSFDFSSVHVNDSGRTDYLTTGLAPSFGKLNSDSIKTMDRHLKIMIAATTRLIRGIPPAERTWEKVVSAMMQNPLIEPTDSEINRADKLIKEGTNVFKFDGSPDNSIVNEVQTWFVSLIKDSDVLRSTKIDIKVLAEIVAQTGATITDVGTLFFKEETHERNLIDIGVLRYPDIDYPYFKVYRIQLKAWSRSRRVLMVQEDYNGITGVFNSRNFKPRKSTMEGISEEIKRKAVAEAEALFA